MFEIGMYGANGFYESNYYYLGLQLSALGNAGRILVIYFNNVNAPLIA